jgi:hypothetical protein
MEHAVCYVVVGNEWVCKEGNDQHDEWTYLIPSRLDLILAVVLLTHRKTLQIIGNMISGPSV